MTDSGDSAGRTAVADTLTSSMSTDAEERVLAPPGYQRGEVLGRGGMGEVLLAKDQRLGREVAIKRMRSSTPSVDATKRFLREAKIQARLDHPAIAPVHELAHDADGRPYFTMKRLAGVTLHEEIAGRATSVQRLLRAFADVCLAVEFAHERGVVHRDLKPTNIMLGNYGDVYILDWGVARMLGDQRRASVIEIGTLGGHTETGALLGTPGYMAPEQARGEDVGPAADVYSLGTILFEILTRTPLHPRGSGAIAATLASPSLRPSAREPSIAPELDDACFAALAADPAERPTARSLAERIQRYLDGDRDLEGRQALAAKSVTAARAALAAGDRAEATRAAGRALALEPASREAAALVTSLVVEPPRDMPAALVAHIHEVETDIAARSSHYAALALCSYFLFLPLMLVVGITKPWLVAATYVVIAAMAGYGEWMYRKRRPAVVPVLIFNLVLMCMLSRLYGPFVLLPGIINTVAFTVGAQPMALERPAVLVIGSLAAFVLPLALEAASLIDTTWQVHDGYFTMMSTGVEIGSAASVGMLIAANVALIFVNVVFGRQISAARRDAARRLEIQAWHLRHLLPDQNF